MSGVPVSVKVQVSYPREYKLPVMPTYLLPVTPDKNAEPVDVGTLTEMQAYEVALQWSEAFVEHVRQRRLRMQAP